MDGHVVINRITSHPFKTEIFIHSEHTYLNARLVCSFLLGQSTVLAIKLEQLDLYEGEQLYVINHGFDGMEIDGLTLQIEVIDRNGIRQGLYLHEVDKGLGQKRAIIRAKCIANRKTVGGTMTIGIGGNAFRIHAHHDGVLQQCKNYITNDEPVKEISINEDEIDRQKDFFDRTTKYPPSKAEIEMLALRHIISETIPDYDVFQLHGAAIALNNQGYIFTADSGTGKTTHINLWLKHLQDAYVVNGDQPIIGVGEKILIYGSPWCGKEGMNTNVAVPLKAIVLMERGHKNTIHEISMKDALYELLRQVYKPSDPGKMKKTMQLLSALEGKVSFYRFEFDNFAEDAFSTAYQGICSVK